MKRIAALISLYLVLGSVGLIFAAIDQPLQNGAFESNLNGWFAFPEPDPEAEEEFITWDEYCQAALLLPYVEEDGSEEPADTNSILSQEFLLPQNAVLLSFDMTMKTERPGFETDIFSVTINDDVVYQLTSSQVNEAALNDNPQVTSKHVDGNGLLQFALYQTIVNTNVSNYLGGNINLVFQLHNDNADNCITSVYIDNVEVSVEEGDMTPPDVETGDMMELWPPDHKYRTFKLSDCVSVIDNMDGRIDVDQKGRIVSIYSDEPEDVNGNGDGKSVNDIVIINDYTFEVRAERQGAGNGRVYGITFEVEDQNGNSTQTTFYLGTPHDQSGDPPVDDGQSAGYVVLNN